VQSVVARGGGALAEFGSRGGWGGEAHDCSRLNTVREHQTTTCVLH
jgi:hypothetical protein